MEFNLTNLTSKIFETKTSNNRNEKNLTVKTQKTETPKIEHSALDAQANITKAGVNTLPAKTPSGNWVDVFYARDLLKQGGEVEFCTTTEKYKKYTNAYNKDEVLALCDAKHTNPQIAEQLEKIFNSSISRNKADSNADIHLSYEDASKIVKSAVENPEEFAQINDLQKYAIFNKKTIKSIPTIIDAMKNNPENSKIIFGKLNNLLANSQVININLNAITPSITNYNEYSNDIDELLEIPKDGFSTCKLNALEQGTYTKEYIQAQKEEYARYQEKQQEKARLEKEKIEQEKREEQEKWDKFNEARDKYENSSFWHKLTHREPTYSDFGLPEPEYDGGFMEAMCDGLTKGTYYTSGLGRADLASKYL